LLKSSQIFYFSAFISQGKNRHTSILEEKIIVEDPENDALIEEKCVGLQPS